jgi:hypothetical protein
MRDESASIVMIAGAKCYGNNIRKLSNQRSDLTRLLQPGLGVEHVEQITGNTKRGRNSDLVRSTSGTNEYVSADRR